jgi:hypothetical protein
MNTQPPTRHRDTRIGSGAPRQPVKTEYIYHWNRIYGALAVLLLLIGLIGYAVHAWVSSPSASQDAGLEVVEASVATLELAAESDEPGYGAPAPVLAEAEITSIPETAMVHDPVLPLEEASTEGSETAVAANARTLRVYLPPDTRVNLRAAPSLSSPVLRILGARDELLLLETGTRFHQVRVAGGIVGWVSRDFSSLEPYPAPSDD